MPAPTSSATALVLPAGDPVPSPLFIDCHPLAVTMIRSCTGTPTSAQTCAAARVIPATGVVFS